MKSLLGNNLIIIGFIVTLCSASVFAESDPNNSAPGWPTRLMGQVFGSIDGEVQNQTEQFRASIFESLVTIETELFSRDLDRGNLGINATFKRRVFNNFSVDESYSVIDFFFLPFHINFPLLESSELTLGALGINLSTSLSLDTINIRQVRSYELRSLTPLREQERFYQRLIQDIDEDQQDQDFDIIYADSNDNPSFRDGVRSVLRVDLENPLIRARYSNLLNIITHPLRIPLTNSNLQRMDVGEISQYSLNGGVVLSGSIGWDQINIPGLSPDIIDSVTASVRTFLRGNFQISILKEEENQALLKVTRRRLTGHGVSLGGDADDHLIFDGIVILGQNTLRLHESVIPFKISTDKTNGDRFDIGYRYNLENSDALEAYFKATRGQLAQSEELSKRPNSGVEKVFTRKQDENIRRTGHQMKLSLIAQRTNTNDRQINNAIITLGDNSELLLFQAINRQDRGHDTIWEDSAHRRYEFTTTLDEEVFLNEDDKGITLRLEGSIEDNYTSGKDLRSYIREVTLITGQDDLFPPIPQLDPIINCDQLGLSPWRPTARRRDLRGPMGLECHQILEESSYGRTSFYYRLGLNRKHIEKFLDIEDHEMWSILELAFGVHQGVWDSTPSRLQYFLQNSYASILNIPLGVLDLHSERGGNLYSARRFFSQWQKLKTIEDPRQLIKGFSELFHSRYYAHRYLRIVRIALHDNEIPYFLSASAPRLFGQISRRGSVFDELDTLTERARRLIDFDQIGPRINTEDSVTMENFKLVQLDADTLELSFKLKQKPKYLHLSVDRTSNWRTFRNLGKLTVLNRGHLTQGENTIHIHRHPSRDDHISKILAPGLFSKEWITISGAISKDGKTWGATSSQRKRVR